MPPRERTKRGLLTPYALACGAVERVENGDVSTTLWKEHCTFHVRQHSNTSGRIFWDSFDTLGEARKRYAQAVRDSRNCF